MKMPDPRQLKNRVQMLRRQHGWSQEELSQRAGISRAAVSAIEIHRLVPSVAAALALAAAFGCRVEDVFGVDSVQPVEETWAWMPTGAPARFWRANVGGRIVRFPAEDTVAGMLPHDGVADRGATHSLRDVHPETTLVLASCDPAAGLLASEYERATGFRMLPLHRSSREALDLLHQGLIHVAGIHLATADSEMGNVRAAREMLGDGFSLLRFATWDEGLAVAPSATHSSVDSVVHDRFRWIGREAGTGARQCQDEVLGIRPKPRRLAKDHRGVAEAIRSGWADVGVCLRLVSEQAGLKFIHVRNEAYDLCFPASLLSDIRMKKLIEVLRSTPVRRLFESLPGYELSHNVEITRVDSST
jgi:molybdate-binding protein/DNA-binding XRE family transcriptional regulator